MSPPARPDQTISDEFGVAWSVNEIDRGAPVGPCLSEPSLTGYTFPDPTNPARFEDLGPWLERYKDHYSIVWIGDLWERATFMRGMANLLLDLALCPRFVEELLERLTDYLIATMRILFERFEFDGIGLSDDYGMQRSMLMSPADWRRFVRPHLARLFSFAHQHDRAVLLHSDGNIYPILPDLVEVGVDILHPLQPEAMDIYRIKREFGSELCFLGGLRTQDLLPRGTPEEIRREVRRLQCEMGRGGGFILAPANVIQADVPLENVLALVEETRKNHGL